MADGTSSYLSPALQAPDFSPTAYAKSLVLATNNASDTPLDLSTPLSRVLFDVQEVDTHIDTLTTQNALPIVSHTRIQTESATRVLETVEEQVQSLNESYKRLEREVVERYEAAEQVRLAAERMVRTLRLGRAVQRAVGLGRQLQSSMEEVDRRDGHRSMLPSARTVLELRECFEGSEGKELSRVQVAQSIRQDICTSNERTLTEKCRAVVREFSMSSLISNIGSSEKTFAQAEETKAKATAALQTLYLLSPINKSKPETFEPTLLISALNSYLQTALQSSLAALDRSLATYPTLDKTLLEISARCQNIIALESLLDTVKPLQHTTQQQKTSDSNLLQPLLRHLDTSSLPSYFWRSLASQLTTRVQGILSRGGVSARTLRSNRERVREQIRDCVDRGYRGKFAGAKKEGVNWEREAAVMVSSVVGPLGR
ncbi:Conserved oligomeric Golgi complex subunit 5 [Pseudocercospora fuligena]|uniref:Conserved oligomeric Golgi complex subunit 5 n=1 Tax=Pseudocercospora fuligena TaxID=685502 RepID=A0A8H6RJD7_9PEZI|nr:Conserved oligomeric Golgi complex subunit 5 [Pseudocercospora fuligena]